VDTGARLDTATTALDPPFAVIDLDALRSNVAALLRRAAGRPIRVASKSVRSRALLRAALGTPGFHGVLAYSLREALWLADDTAPGGAVSDDVVVAYPTVDRAALGRLAADPVACERVTIMVDDVAQLDLVPGPVRVCLDLDASLRLFGGRVHVGARRSPVHSADATAALAREVLHRGFRLVGLMAYEAQIAGVGDHVPGRPVRSGAVRAVQRVSAAELAMRRAAVVAAVGEIAPLEFVNGGGTGSLERTVAESAVTEVAAGSGLFGPALFDRYRAFTPRPAALFALPVVRRPAPGVVTVLGGGWIASGAPGPDRLPVPVYPAGLRLSRAEGAGEVQTPLVGPAADRLAIGDRVWFRHAKAGELCEHVTDLHLVEHDRLRGSVPTYRGEGRAFG
jgi:D-serine deaminase-like pyridoxal phosphate-dependent protein